MRVGFLPFIPKPVTEYSTVYTSLLKKLKISKQLDQNALPMFCDKGVFRILVEIYLQRKDEVQILIQMLDGFHVAKDLESRKVSDRQKIFINDLLRVISYWQTLLKNGMLF